MGIDPTIPDPNRFQDEKRKLIKIINELTQENCTTHPHPFFGYLTPEQWGKAVYKHLDHHLRQFSG